MSTLRALLFIPIAGIAFLHSCSGTKRIERPGVLQAGPLETDSKLVAGADNFLEDLMARNSQFFSEILGHRKDWNVQVIYTRIDRDDRGDPHLLEHRFNVDPSRYFYPASTVKLPVVLLSLQRLNELRERGIEKSTAMITERSDTNQTAVYNDPGTVDGRPNIAQYIRKILLVSDNDAFNRLYEFLGQDYINGELRKKGYLSAEITHRLGISMSPEENRLTNPVRFLDRYSKTIYEQEPRNSSLGFANRSDFMGKGYYSGAQLIKGPMDFSKKNRISLSDLNRILVGLIFPKQIPSNQRFDLTEEDNRFILKYMSQLPTESSYPPYYTDTTDYWPAYCKFLLAGSEKGPLPENIRIFNKVGDAYGQLTDVAYIVDLKNRVEFFLSATIYCNSDGILNDDKYDYETVGLPFMKHLGGVIYEQELIRPRKYKPDFSAIMFKYDK